MTPAEFTARPHIDHLRLMVRNLDHCNETFNQQFSYQELWLIHRAWMLSGWDIYPDQWSERQVREALNGRPPEWDDDERPKYEREQEPDERSAQDWKEHAE